MPVNEKIMEYVDRFHENLPLFMMPSMSDEELIILIDECLASGKPYECDTSDDPAILY